MAGQQIIQADSVSVSQPARELSFAGKPLGSFLQQPAVRKSLPALAMVGAVGLAATAYFALSAPAQTMLYQGLGETDKAAVADALTAAGVGFTLDPASGALTVDADAVHEARMLLAGQGLPKAKPSGDSVVAALPMGSSRAVEGETLRSAREMDLARTIEAIDSVLTARVHLATPEPSVFVREAREPSASVMLTLQQGRTLSEAQVRAIRHLVSSSVPGLTAAAVSVVDQSGALLSAEGTSGKQQMFDLQLQVEERYRQAVTALLLPMLGTGNFSVEVHADIDASEQQSTRETYPKDDRALRSEEGNKSVNSAGASDAVGIPGALSNQPPPASQLVASPPGASDAANPAAVQSEENYTRSFDVGREIAVKHQPQGALRRLSVAVALREVRGTKPKKAGELAEIESLVKGAVGYDAARGDTVAISASPFAETGEGAPAFWDQPWFLPLLQQIGGVLAAIIAFFVIGRPLIKAAKARAAVAAERQETERLLTAATGTPRATPSVTLEMIEAEPSYEARAKLVRSFIQQDPERASLVVRQMIRERANG
jgi:flagellar M-ring protein FliF